MYDLITLCQKTGIPEEVTAEILAIPRDDYLGFQSLREQLMEACRIWDTYRKLGIPEDIYLDTMGCFSRFLREYEMRCGVYGFDRAMWTHYQTTGQIFRIGQLEYELADIPGERQIALHVPSGADLSLPQLRCSWVRAKELLERIFPEYRGVPWTCQSWLLSPDLPGLLPENAKILAFQRSFQIREGEDDGDVATWVYPGAVGDEMNLPEDTTLQQNLKYFLLAEFPFRSGSGLLIPDPFLE